MARKSNQYWEAFKEGSNLVGLTSLTALSAATLNPLPLLFGLVAEAVYLLFVPDSRWYDARLSRRNDAEIESRRQQLKAQTFTRLDAAMQARFTRLEEVRRQIELQAQDDQKWFREVLRKLDYLLEKFLLFAAKEAEFDQYLKTVWSQECKGIKNSGRPGRIIEDVQASYDTEMAQIQTLQQGEQDANTRAILAKRIEVLQQRREGVGKIGRILTNLQYQLALLEDTFGLINDQIRARSPEQVLADIEGVVYQTDSMTQLLEELAPYEQAAA